MLVMVHQSWSRFSCCGRENAGRQLNRDSKTPRQDGQQPCDKSHGRGSHVCTYGRFRYTKIYQEYAGHTEFRHKILDNVEP